MTYIESAEFINCQSLRNVKYEFSPGLNVLAAGNSTGKSVFFKALKVAVGADYIGVRDLKHIVSYGEKSAGFLVTLSDGTSGGFIATPNSILYLYNGDRYVEPQRAFIRKIGVLLDYSSGFVLNMLDPDQDLLFVQSKESTNYSVLKLLSDCEDLERVVDDTSEQLVACSELYNLVSSELNSTNSMLNMLHVEDIEDLEHKAHLMSNARDFVGVIIQMYSLLDRLIFLEDETMLLLNSHITLLDCLLVTDKLCSGNLEHNIRMLESYSILLDIFIVFSRLRVSSDSLLQLSDGLVRILDLAYCTSKFIAVTEMSVLYETARYILLSMYLNLENMCDITALNNAYSDFILSIHSIQCPVFGKVAYFESGCIAIE